MLRGFRRHTAKAGRTLFAPRAASGGAQLVRTSRLVFEPLEPRLVLGGNSPLISEFMAINHATLQDEDNAYSDWLEIHNPTESAIDLDGWYLTDDVADLTKWQFPGVSLAPGDYLVVFASDKDRTDPLGELHANFKLSGGGEYLALVEPGGSIIAHQYAPEFPQQYTDVSYGLQQGVVTTLLITQPAGATVLVPPDGSLSTTWTGAGFDDTGWTSGTTGVGYDTGTDYGSLIETDIEGVMRGTNASAYVRIPFSVADPSEVDTLLLRMKYDDGYVAYLNGTEVARSNAPTTPPWNSTATAEHGQPVSSSMAQDFDGGGAAYTLSRYGSSPGAQVISGGPDGRFLRLIYDDVTNNINRMSFDQVHEGPAPRVTADFDFRFTSADSDHPADGMALMLLPTSTYGASGPGTDGSYVSEEPNLPGVFAVAFDLYPEPSGVNDVSAHWDGTEIIDVRMSNSQIDLDAGVFHRAHIELVEDRRGNGSRVTVTLTPDIFGTPGTPVTPIDNILIPGLVPYESRVEFSGRTGGLYFDADLDNIAVEFAPASSETAYEDIDITEHRGLLLAGDNVLAIHGLNLSAGDADFLVLPELVASEVLAIQPDVETYFTIPTPGSGNETGSAAPSEAITFSQVSGTFVNSFSLTMSLDSPSVDSPEAVIHYTTNGSVPTEASAVYAGPLWISTTSRIRARAFEPGHSPGPIQSHGYIFLDSSAVSFNSDVPLIVLDTYGIGLGDTLLTPATSVFIETRADGRARITDQPEFAGRSGLRIRGHGSQGWPKKQYAFEVWDEGNEDTTPIAARLAEDLSVSLFGMPAQSDWVIQGPYSDKTLMRNYLSYSWSNEIGQYASRVRFAEVFVNLNGGKISYPSDYMGVYVFMEKIKRDPNRVDIAQLTAADNSPPWVTGGYIYKKDKAGAGDQPWTTSRGQELRHVEPKARDITLEQQTYLEEYINDFEAALYGANFKDPDVGYAAYIDVASWIDHWIVVELAKNIDGFRLSTYYHKDRRGKIKMGPVWDYHLSLGNADYLQGWLPQGWYGELLGDDDYPYWRRLFQDSDFAQRLADRWHELRQDRFSTANLMADVDQAASILGEAQVRNFQRWNILGTRVWPNWFIGNTWQEEVDWMKAWLADRAAWMDSQFPPAPTFSQDGGIIGTGFELTMSEPAATVYYTLDGTDPRLSGGGVSPTAQIYSTSGGTQSTLVEAGSNWKYLDDGSNQGDSNQDTAWRETGFDDSSWASGPAQLGYGDGDEATVVSYGPDSSNKYTTTYFRHTFNMADASEVTALTLRLLRDDGAVVYLNGQELDRNNMPSGTVTYTTWATSAIGAGSENTFYSTGVNESLLVDGDNLLAVEIHQANRTSTDISFDLELEATIDLGGTSGDPIPLDTNTRVIARSKNGSQWSGPTKATFVLAALPELAVTEINYNPYHATAAELAVDPNFISDDFEFIELRNTGGATASLVGVELVDGITFDFTASSVRELAAGERVVVVRNRAAFETRYGTGVSIAGEYDLLLSNGGERIVLQDGVARTILDFAYDDTGRWPGRADGKGAALVLIDTQGDYNDADNWKSSVRYGGTPGADPEPEIGIVVNEVLSHTDLPLVDAIELYNTTGSAIDIGGWYLSDSWGWESSPQNGNYKKYRIPGGTIIPAGGYLVFDENDFNPTPENPGPNDFALDGAAGDDVWVMKADEAGNLTHFADHVEFGAAPNGESFGRQANSAGKFYFFPMTDRTLDPPGPNSGPRIGPELVISEVMYNPGPMPEADDLEFIEIYNPTGQSVSLTDWRLDKGIDFDFAAGTTLAPREALVVVWFDPANAPAKEAAFRSRYGIDASVQIVGGHNDRLDDDGERVQLQDWDTPLPGPPPIIPHPLEDEVDYEDTWHLSTGGGGDSLNRFRSSSWGDEPASWIAAAPTPGTVDMGGEVTAIVGRYIFYNNSAFDIGPAGANDDAIAPDKTALLPGGTATFANYTSYALGLNGIMIDIFDLQSSHPPNLAALGASDFTFRAGNNNNPSGWGPVAVAPTVDVRPGEGLGGSDRVTLIWPDNAIEKQWLQVTVLANEHTGLTENDVFYFGNAIGESGNSAAVGGVSDGDAIVNVQDILITRGNPHPFWDPADIGTPNDFDRDARVDATDILIARANQTWSMTALKLIQLSGGKAAGDKAWVYDAATEQAVVGTSNVRKAPSAKLTWLYEYEQIRTQDRPSETDKPLEKAVDKLLAISWQ